MSARRIGRLRIGGVVIASCVAPGLLGAGSAFAETKTFIAAGCSNWEVPAGVSQLVVAAAGAAGQQGRLAEGGAGGKGDEVSATVEVSAHEAFDVCVAHGGGSGGSELGEKGGGASGLARSSDFSAPVLVAGGGGGGGGETTTCSSLGCSSTAGGTGGSAGMAGKSGSSGKPGAVEGGSKSNTEGPGAGGNGASTIAFSGPTGFEILGGGGGGGGGYVGGGGGGNTAGGAGGTDFCGGSGVTCGAINADAGAGTGSVTITYTALPTSKEQCKEDGWMNFGTAFKNQGRCVSFVEAEKHAS